MIFGPLNVPALLPSQASDMYAKNLANFTALLVKDGEYTPDWDDEVVGGTVLVREGVIVHGPSRILVEEWEAAGGGQRPLKAVS
jgi:NAD(P) transhydrogenase subunit alpha